jgi:hypothetical protein
MIEFQDFRERLEDVTSYLYDWQMDANMDFQFAALDQWDKADKKRLNEEGRPALTFDRTRPIIASVAGAEITNRYEPKFLPRDADLNDVDVPFSEAGNKVYKWIRDRGNFENAESAAFQSSLICGVGCTEYYIDYEEDPDGMIMLDRVPIWEIGWDPTSVKPNYTDARFVMRDRWVDDDEIISRFGAENFEDVINLGNSEVSQGRGLMDRVFGREVEDPRHTYFHSKTSKYYDPKRNRVRVWEMYRKERRYMTRIFLPDGSDHFVPKSETKEALDLVRSMLMQASVAQAQALGAEVPPELDIPPVDFVEDFPVTKIFRSYHAGNHTIKEDEVNLRQFPYQFITCFEDWKDPQRLYHFGLMRSMRDPQKYANKFFSHMVTGMIEVDIGKLQTPKPKYEIIPNHTEFRGVETLLMHATQAISSASGVNEQYGVGTAQDLKRTAATAVQSVKDSNLVTLSQPFDALRLYKKMQGRLTLDFVGEYVQPKQLERLLGSTPDAQMFIGAVKDGSLSQQYEVIAEESAASKSKQMDIFAKIMETSFIPQLLEMQVPIPPTLAKYFPFPADINSDFQQVLLEAKELMEMQAAIQKMEMQIAMAQMGMQQSSGLPPEGQDQMAMMQAEQAMMPPELPPEGGPPVDQPQ